ncbi:MAG: flagellar export chaperone FliS [Acidobacteria bacterium]|nr:MAG: flagellar export chaperone FliS [Acidobacteriota bacterium]
MAYDVARNTYQEIEANASNGLQLVVMLYDGAIRFLNDASACVKRRDLPGKVLAVDRALAIIGELQATLKMDEGAHISSSLDGLYTYMTQRILDASLRLDPAPFDEVVRLLANLNNGWKEIAQRNTPQMPNSQPAAVPGTEERPLELFG